MANPCNCPVPVIVSTPTGFICEKRQGINPKQPDKPKRRKKNGPA